MIDEAVVLQDLALPEIELGESAAAYKLRIQPFIELLAVKAAIAPALKQETDGQRITHNTLSLAHLVGDGQETVKMARTTVQVLWDLR